MGLFNRNQDDQSLRCSFCRKHEKAVGKLISSPRDYPRAYICEECMAVCHSIIVDDSKDDPFPGNPLLSTFLEATSKWLQCENLGEDPSGPLSEMRQAACAMFGPLDDTTTRIHSSF